MLFNTRHAPIALSALKRAAYTRPTISTTEEDATHFTTIIRREVLADRALHDKAQRAFVSWVKSYSKHAASSIFRLSDIDWVATAQAWGLLRLPKMPELAKTKFTGDRFLGLNIDFDAYSYKDKAREAHRREELQAYKDGLASGEIGPAIKDTRTKEERRKAKAWTRQKELKQTKEDRREKKGKKREHVRVSKMTPDERELWEIICEPEPLAGRYTATGPTAW